MEHTRKERWAGSASAIMRIPVSILDTGPRKNRKTLKNWVSISDYEDPGFHFGYRATEKQKNPEK